MSTYASEFKTKFNRGDAVSVRDRAGVVLEVRRAPWGVTYLVEFVDGTQEVCSATIMNAEGRS